MAAHFNEDAVERQAVGLVPRHTLKQGLCALNTAVEKIDCD